MTEKFILLYYRTILWNRQTNDDAALLAIRVKYKEIFQEQFAGLIIFSITLSTCIPNTELIVFLDTHKTA